MLTLLGSLVLAFLGGVGGCLLADRLCDRFLG